MIRTISVILLCAAAMAGTLAPAQARRQAAPAADTPPAKAETATSGQPVKVGTFNDWGAYLSKGKNKTCYAFAKPKERKPDGSKEAAYVFIADRPGANVHNEVSIAMGFPIKETGPSQAKVGSASFDLVAKGSNAWLKDPEEEAKFVEALQHSSKLIVKAPTLKGAATTDSYSLAGLKQALERVGKDCK